MSWFALSSALLGPIATMAVRQYQPRYVLVATLLAFALGNLTIALVPGYAIIILVRVVQGMMLPVFVSVANAALAELAGPGRRGEVIALVNVGTVAVSVAGLPAGVALANHFGWGVTFSGLAVLGMVAAAAVGVTFPSMRTARPTSTSPAASARASTTEPMHAQVAILGEPAVQGHLPPAMLFTAMFAAYTYLAAFLQIVAALEGGGVVLALMGFGAAGLVGNWIAGRLNDCRLRRRPLSPRR